MLNRNIFVTHSCGAIFGESLSKKFVLELICYYKILTYKYPIKNGSNFEEVHFYSSAWFTACCTAAAEDRANGKAPNRRFVTSANAARYILMKS